MKHIDLFSGIGGFALASSWVWGEEYENVGHCEIEPYPCKVYHRHFPNSECIGDITKVDWTKYTDIDLLTGGFPCQPHSVAGKRKASADSRDLWGECKRAVSVLRPRWAVFENVPGLLVSEHGRFFNRVLSDLAEVGYDAEWYTIGAWQVGAHHKRDRIWIVAYPSISRNSTGNASGEVGEIRQGSASIPGGICGTVPIGADDVAHPNSLRHEGNMGAAFGQGRENASDTEPRSGSASWNAVLGTVEGEDVAHAGGNGSASRISGQKQGKEGNAGISDNCCGEELRHTTGPGLPDWSGGEMGQPWPVTEFERPSGEDVGDTERSGLNREPRRGSGEESEDGHTFVGETKPREVERVVRLLVDGVSSPMDGFVPVTDRVARLKGLGNAIVPQVAYVILSAIKNADTRRQ